MARCRAPNTPVVDGNQTALGDNGMNVSSSIVTTLKNWIDGRRTYISGELAKVASPFEITNNGGSDFTNGSPNLTLAGKAPMEVKFIRMNGATTNEIVTWTTLTNWSISRVLTNGANPLNVQGYGRTTNLLSGAFDSITVTY